MSAEIPGVLKPEHAEDPLGDEEASAYSLRRHLGLRPVAFDKNAAQTKGAHPDQRPCPSWCWVAQQDEYDHDVESDHPSTTEHAANRLASVGLVSYRGYRLADTLHLATLQVDVTQLGQAVPRIRLSRHDAGDFHADLFKLSVSEAREVVKVLNYVIALVENG